MGIAAELSSQWENPGDVLSLLLLIGGEVVQKAIAQLFGVYIQPTSRSPLIYLTPVAFSFGWVGYAFMSLTSVIGDKQLMPSAPEGRCIAINCDSGYSRVNCSWLLDRIIRDHELAVEAHPGPEAAKLNSSELKMKAGVHEENLRISLRIDTFNLEGETGAPSIDHVWVLGWLTILAQLGISIAPWLLYSDWAIFLVTSSSTLFALLTGSLRQWSLEKWPGRRLNNKSKSPPAGAPGTDTPSTAAALSNTATRASAMEKGQAAGPSSISIKSESPTKLKSKVVCLTR